MATVVVDAPERKPMSKIDVLRFLSSISQRSRKKHDDFLQLMCDLKEGRINFDDLLTNVKQLFRNHKDLIRGFNTFLPRKYAIELPIEEKEKPTEIKDAVSLVHRLKEQLPEDKYKRFLDSVNMYRCQKISVYSLYRDVTTLLKSHRDLLEQTICFFPDHAKEMNPRCQSPRSKKRSRNLDSATDEQEKKRRTCTEKKAQCLSNGKKDPCNSFPVHDLLEYQGCNPSYKFLPESQRPASASERTEPDASVLNDAWVSVPHEGYDPKPKRLSLREERSSSLEDDMFEMDVLLRSVRAAAKKANKLMESMKDKDKASKPQSPIRKGKRFSRLNLRCIEHLYGEYGLDVLDALHKDAGRVLPLIAARLRQKEKELTERRKEFKEAWAEACWNFVV